jgi:hypothetical protein
MTCFSRSSHYQRLKSVYNFTLIAFLTECQTPPGISTHILSLAEANARVQYTHTLYQQPTFDTVAILEHLQHSLNLFHQFASSGSPAPTIPTKPASSKPVKEPFKTPKPPRKLLAEDAAEGSEARPSIPGEEGSAHVAMQSAIDLLGVLGHNALRIHYLLVLRTICARTSNADLNVWATSELAAEYMAADRTRRAGLVLARAETLFERETVSPTNQVLFQLRNAQYYAILGLSDKRQGIPALREIAKVSLQSITHGTSAKVMGRDQQSLANDTSFPASPRVTRVRLDPSILGPAPCGRQSPNARHPPVPQRSANAKLRSAGRPFLGITDPASNLFGAVDAKQRHAPPATTFCKPVRIGRCASAARLCQARPLLRHLARGRERVDLRGPVAVQDALGAGGPSLAPTPPGRLRRRSASRIWPRG